MEDEKKKEELEEQEIGEDEQSTDYEESSVSEKDKSKEKKLKIGIAIVCVALLGGICAFATQQSQQPKTVKQDKIETKTSKKNDSKKKSSKKTEAKAEETSDDTSNNDSSANKSSESNHQHEWVQQYKTVHHDAETHDEKVKVKDAYDEPVYTQVQHLICDECGADITNNSGSHIKKHLLNGETGTYHTKYETEKTDSVHHDAEYTTKTVTDKEAYDEQVADGWKCSTCGATKK